MTWLHFWTCTTWLVLAGPTFAVANTACEDDDMSHLQLKETLGKRLEQFFFKTGPANLFFPKRIHLFNHLFCLKMLEDADVGIHVWYIFAYIFSIFNHKHQPNVDRYTVHGASGFFESGVLSLFCM